MRNTESEEDCTATNQKMLDSPLVQLKHKPPMSIEQPHYSTPLQPINKECAQFYDLGRAEGIGQLLSAVQMTFDLQGMGCWEVGLKKVEYLKHRFGPSLVHLGCVREEWRTLCRQVTA